MCHSTLEIGHFKVVLPVSLVKKKPRNLTSKTNISSKKIAISLDLKQYCIKEMLYIYFTYSSEKSTIIHILLENDFFRENVLMKESKKDWSRMNSYQFFPFLYVLFSVYMWNEREDWFTISKNMKKILKNWETLTPQWRDQIIICIGLIILICMTNSVDKLDIVHFWSGIY